MIHHVQYARLVSPTGSRSVGQLELAIRVRLSCCKRARLSSVCLHCSHSLTFVSPTLVCSRATPGSSSSCASSRVSDLRGRLVRPLSHLLHQLCDRPLLHGSSSCTERHHDQNMTLGTRHQPWLCPTYTPPLRMRWIFHSSMLFCIMSAEQRVRMYARLIAVVHATVVHTYSVCLACVCARAWHAVPAQCERSESISRICRTFQIGKVLYFLGKRTHPRRSLLYMTNQNAILDDSLRRRDISMRG